MMNGIHINVHVMGSRKVVKTEEKKKGVSRRIFLKGAAFLGALTAMEGLTSGVPFTPKQKTPAKAIIKVAAKTVDKTAAEIYQVQSAYKRFDQSYTAISRARWDKTSRVYEWTGGGTKQAETRLEQMRQGIPGYTLRDYALMHGASTVHDLSGSHAGMEGLRSWSTIRPMSPPKPPDIEFKVDLAEASKTVKKAAKFFGASGVGICKLDRRWVYTNTRDGRPIVFEDVDEWYETDEKLVIPESHKYVVVMLVEQRKAIYARYAPTALHISEAMRCYSMMALLSGCLAEFIRGLGYKAISCGNDTALSIPLAIDAGLGQLGRHDRLITPQFGPLVRICKVFTDMPLKLDKPIDFGVTEFCEVCDKCARACPMGAITFVERTFEGPSKSNNPGVLKWYSDPEKCYNGWSETGTNCGICLSVCPFSKGPTQQPLWTHDVTRWFIENVPAMNPVWASLDDVLGYGKHWDPRRFWEES